MISGDSKNSPIFIIGAARSGTNMLRDILTSIDGYCTWDCDEINPIFRHGNLDHYNDVFTKKMATTRVKEFIRKEFVKISRAHKGAQVIEKTCANTLRLPFLKEIFPEARYIYIYRDGRDATASAIKRWKAPFELKYTLNKARYIPKLDLPYYVWKFGKLRLLQLLGEKKLKFWGVKIPELESLIMKSSLAEVCAWQWRVCNEHTINALKHIEDKNKCIVKYEDFVMSPMDELMRVCSFLDCNIEDYLELTKKVSRKSIGNYLRDLNMVELGKVNRIISSVQKELGYQSI